MKFEVEPLDGAIGVEVVGIDLDREIDQGTAEALNQVWLDSAIVLFRGIGTSNERHLRLSRAFGQLEVHPVESIRLEGHPEVICLAQKGDKKQMTYYFDGEPIVGRIPFHTDLIYTTTPNRGALLRMVEKPEVGGQTGWIDTAAAYDGLDDAMKARIDSLEARFDFVSDLREMRFGNQWNVEIGDFGSVDYPEFPDVAHPLVWTHPLSGRKSLSLSTVHLVDMVGMEREEGDPILKALVDHTLESRFRYTHDWEEGDVVLWDNLRTMHTAMGSPPGYDRVVHRTTIKGDHQTGRLL
jgi:taurine dioxygenase